MNIMNASELRSKTMVDMERADWLTESTYAGMQQAAEKGKHSAELCVYDKIYGRWLGDVSDAVIEEVERRFTEAGYELGWENVPVNGCIRRIVKW